MRRLAGCLSGGASGTAPTAAAMKPVVNAVLPALTRKSRRLGEGSSGLGMRGSLRMSTTGTNSLLLICDERETPFRSRAASARGRFEDRTVLDAPSSAG